MQKRLLLPVFLCLASCGDSSNIGKIDGSLVAEKEFVEYLNIKGGQSDTPNARQQYIENYALLSAVENKATIDLAKLDAEVAEYRRQLLVNRYFNDYLKDVASEQAVRNYYTSHLDEFQSQKGKVAHILIRIPRQATLQQRQVAQTKIHEVYSKLKSGEDFSALAKQYSDDQISAKKGGDLGWIKPGAVSDDFSSKAFSLAKGDFSEPFKTDFGYHVVMLLDDFQTITQPLEAVKGKIAYQLRAKAKQAEKLALLDSIDYEVYPQ